jgi:hypothetical protein
MATPATPASLARRIDGLLADCERYGTLPFSVLARCAFVGMELLRSLERVGLLSAGARAEILRSIPSVASEFVRDQARYANGTLSTEDFLAAYGHLRPSSFDISSRRYGDAWEIYAPASGVKQAVEYPDIGAARAALEGAKRPAQALLRSLGFATSVDELMEFVLAAIPARERFKFEFMKSVDAILESIAQFGACFGFSRADMACLPLEPLRNAAANSLSAAVEAELRRAIEFNKKRWNLTCAIRLPYLIGASEDVDAFQLAEWTPNFVSNRSVTAACIHLDGTSGGPLLTGRIVLIRAADPGYDWIFGHGIAGLITEFGGAGSHMAIRAAEFNLPAAIGVGEVIFDRLVRARVVELDCASGVVRAVA